MKLNAIPENYTETPPTDTAVVKKNTIILKKLLCVNVSLSLSHSRTQPHLSITIPIYFCCPFPIPQGPYKKSLSDLIHRTLTVIYRHVNALAEDIAFTLNELSRAEYSFGVYLCVLICCVLALWMCVCASIDTFSRKSIFNLSNSKHLLFPHTLQRYCGIAGELDAGGVHH